MHDFDILSPHFHCFLSDYLTLSKVKGIALQKGKHAKEITLSGFHPPFNGQLKIHPLVLASAAYILKIHPLKYLQYLF